MKDGGSLLCRLRTDGARKNRRECLRFDTTEPRSTRWGKTGRSDVCFLSRRPREVRLLPFVLFIVPLCLLSFFRVCATLVLVASSLSSKPKHIIWSDQWICVPWPDHWRPPTDWTLKLIWIFLSFFRHASRCLYLRHYVHGYGCISTPMYHRRKHESLFFPKHLSFFKNSFLSPVRWNIQKINSSLQIAQSSVPNPLQSLLVMIYSTRTKDISRTPEYIYWQVLWFYLQKILQTQSKGCSSFYQRSLDFWPHPSHSHFGRWASSVILSISVVR